MIVSKKEGKPTLFSFSFSCKFNVFGTAKRKRLSQKNELLHIRSIEVVEYACENKSFYF
jgi:hypothetical protein